MPPEWPQKRQKAKKPKKKKEPGMDIQMMTIKFSSFKLYNLSLKNAIFKNLHSLMQRSEKKL